MAALCMIDKVALIQEVRDHPVLWKGEHEKYGDRFCTAAAWKSIAQKLKISENTLRAKWKNLRDTFRNILKKSSMSYLDEYNGKWKYFHLMAFIKDEYKDDESSIEFIVETDTGEESYDENQSNISEESELLIRNNTTDKESSKSNCDGRSNQKNKTQSESDEDIIRRIDRREYDDHTYSGDPKEINDNIDNISTDGIPSKRRKISHKHANYDVMFLRSLAPYFKQLDSLRKLVMRSRIQDLLLNEIAKQNSSKSDS